MNHILIASVILVVWVHSNCLAASVENFGGWEIPTAAERFKRATLATSIEVLECRQIGGNCGLSRDRTSNPSKVTLRPCCNHLFCAGLGPLEIKNNAGGAHSSSDLVSIGICSLGLDNNQATRDKSTYEKYVKSL